MKVKRVSNERQGLTRIEVLISSLVVAAIVVVFLPILARRLAKAHVHPPEVDCIRNLKSIGNAFQSWANDHDGRFPMRGYEDEAGSARASFDGKVAGMFQLVSNELSVPWSVHCRSDQRLPATNWLALHESNISYFVGLDAVDTKPNMILSGDRDIAENGRLLSGTANLTTNRPVAWHRLLHREGGNLLFADGNVQQVDTVKLRQLLSQTGDATNRVLFPQ